MAKGLVKKRLGEAFGDCGPLYVGNNENEFISSHQTSDPRNVFSFVVQSLNAITCVASFGESARD